MPYFSSTQISNLYKKLKELLKLLLNVEYESLYLQMYKLIFWQFSCIISLPCCQTTAKITKLSQNIMLMISANMKLDIT